MPIENPCRDEVVAPASDPNPIIPVPIPAPDPPAPTIDFAPIMPPLGDPVYPEMHIPINTDDPGLGGPSAIISGGPLYASATREVTIVKDASYFSPGQLLEIRNLLRSENLPNHPYFYKTLKPEETKEEVDMFRASLMIFWSSLPESEEMVNRITGVVLPEAPNSIYDTPAPPFPYRDIGDRWNVPLRFDTTEGTRRYERGPTVYAPIPAPELLQRIIWVHGTPETLRFEFDPHFLHEDIIRPDPSGTVVALTKDEFESVYLNGEASQLWDDASIKFTPDQRSIFSSGIFNYGHFYTDFVYDAPAAFHEREMNSMLVSPFHSADINLQLENIEGYKETATELKLPNIYHHYQSSRIDKLIRAGQLGIPLDASALAPSILSSYGDLTPEGNEYETKSILKFPSDRVAELEEINKTMRGYAENFVEININSTQKGMLNSTLQRNKMDTLLLELIAPSENTRLADPLWAELSSPTKVAQILDDTFLGSQENSTRNIDITVNDRTSSNISSKINPGFFRLLKDIPTIDNLSMQERNLNEYPLYYTGWDNHPLLAFEETIKSQIFLSMAEQYIADNNLARSYADILNGQKAYSETVGYKIEKYSIDENNVEQLIQEFLLMDNDEIKRINFIDSQILPNKRYVYKILTINLVLATKYSYVPPSAADDEKVVRVVNVKVNSYPEILISYAPFFEKKVSTMDRPPIFPQVSFLPYRGIDNKYSILLQGNYGETKEKPLYVGDGFLEEDKEKVASMYEAQNLMPGLPITYKSDSLPERFEFLRIDRRPTRYQDFFDGSAIVSSVDAESKTGFFSIDVEPNQYYYYIFRTYDAGGVSNPTEVFRVRIVSYQNGIFMEMDTIEMHPLPEVLDMKFERILKITPKYEQKTINFTEAFEKLKDEVELPSNALTELRKELGLISVPGHVAEDSLFQRSAPSVEDVTLGNVPESDLIWDKKFKIRIKSKKTGRAIDLNIKFAQDKKTLVIDDNS